jgi:hypothetical protein
MIYLLSAAIGLKPGCSSTVYIYTKAIYTEQQNEHNNGKYIKIRIHKGHLYKIKQKHIKHTTT